MIPFSALNLRDLAPGTRFARGGAAETLTKQTKEAAVRNRFLVVGGVLAALAVTAVPPLEAQRVSADIHLGGWPVSGTVRIGDPYPYSYPARYGYYGRGYYDYRDDGRPRGRRGGVVVVRRDFPKLLVVDRRRPFVKHGKKIKVFVGYYDRHCGLYFDRYRRGLAEVSLFEYEGRYYPFDARYDERYDRYDRDDRDDRYDRERRSRRDRDDRDDDDYGSWEHDH
jgi:hypothetical protein